MIISALTLALICTTVTALIDDPEEMARMRNEVRSNNNGVNWARFTYEGKDIVADGVGEDYDGFLQGLQENNRAYGYVRFVVDGTPKFAFITWIGPGVSPLKKARVSTDKAFVKRIITEFSKEILADEKKDLEERVIVDVLRRATAFNYGTGQ